MTTPTRPDPIRLEVSPSVLSDRPDRIGDVYITPDIARRIVALLSPEDVRKLFVDHCLPAMTEGLNDQSKRIAALDASNRCRLDEILDCHKRIAALEARCSKPLIAALPGPVTSMADPIQPAQPQGDDAAARAPVPVLLMNGDWTIAGKPATASQASSQYWKVIDGMNDQIAALRAKLTATEISGSQAIERLRSERDRLAAQVESLARERDMHRQAAEDARHNKQSALNAMNVEADRADRALADLATMKEQYEAANDTIKECNAALAQHGVRPGGDGHPSAGINDLADRLAAMTERAEKAEAKCVEAMTDFANKVADNCAASAEADALAGLLRRICGDEPAAVSRVTGYCMVREEDLALARAALAKRGDK